MRILELRLEEKFENRNFAKSRPRSAPTLTQATQTVLSGARSLKAWVWAGNWHITMSVTPRRESHELDRVLKLSLEAVALYKDLLAINKLTSASCSDK